MSLITDKNIFEELRHDHDAQRELIDRLLETSGDSEARERTFLVLRRELTSHAEMEERHLYSPMMQSDMSQEKARHGVSEHKELDDFLEELEATDFSSSAWIATARKLAHRLIHHLDEEEHEVFQLAGRVLSDEQKTGLAGAYAAGMADRREERRS